MSRAFLILTVCAAAAILPTAAVECPSCDDWNACTVDTCDTSTGFCRHDPLDCDDGNPCTLDGCFDDQLGLGGCYNTPLADDTACDDGNPCTLGDACSAGTCAGSLQPSGTSCEDGNACTVGDACDDVGICVGSPLEPGTACDDGSLCTTGDQCALAGDGGVFCDGTATDCGDGDLCTEDSCDPLTGDCSSIPVVCDDGNECTDDACDPASGACGHAAASGSCENGDLCTVDDYCSGGNCTPGDPNDCDDGVDCTYDSCRTDELPTCAHDPNTSLCPDPPAGSCYYYECRLYGCEAIDRLSGFCDTGNPCIAGHCVRGSCEVDYFIECDDQNPCTDDSCDFSVGCINEPVADGTSCAPDLCTAGSCLTGTCQTGPVDCDDGDPCTVDTCDPGTGCVNTLLNCDDSNACTTDYCDASGDCINDPLVDGTSCVLDLCTLGGCVSGNCEATGPIDCDDRDPCTVDSCDNGTGCFNTPVDCDDGNACTANTCGPDGGCVTTPLDGAPCYDGDACTTGELCAGGTCVGGSALNCDDGDPCTVDSCDSASGCVNTPVDMDCDDGNACTADTCGPDGGCVTTPLDGMSCYDGDACTVDDLCVGSTCVGGSALDCDDGNVCTADSCDSVAGCTYTALSGSPVTCGVGECARTVDGCLDGVPQDCVPGEPSPEVPNGLDDDCDGEVDEATILADCSMTPSTLDRSSQGRNVSFQCAFSRLEGGGEPVPIRYPVLTGAFYVSRADRADTTDDDVPLPDPTTVACPDPALGSLFEPGIVENAADRTATGGNTILRFNRPSDGDCATRDGDRQDLLGVLGGVPHKTEVTVCIRGVVNGETAEGCVTALFKNPRSR